MNGDDEEDNKLLGAAIQAHESAKLAAFNGDDDEDNKLLGAAIQANERAELAAFNEAIECVRLADTGAPSVFAQASEFTSDEAASKVLKNMQTIQAVRNLTRSVVSWTNEVDPNMMNEFAIMQNKQFPKYMGDIALVLWVTFTEEQGKLQAGGGGLCLCGGNMEVILGGYTEGCGGGGP